MADLLNIRIELDDESLAIARDNPELQEEFEEELKRQSQYYTKLALAAYKSWVPYRTGQLRNFIRSRKVTSNFKEVVTQITVPNTVHTNSPGKKKPTFQELADILDNGRGRGGARLHRRPNASQPYGKFNFTAPGIGSVTANWEQGAFNEFNEIFLNG